MDASIAVGQAKESVPTQVEQNKRRLRGKFPPQSSRLWTLRKTKVSLVGAEAATDETGSPDCTASRSVWVRHLLVFAKYC